MTKEELNTRIEKKNTEIAKIEKRINKWTTGMNDEAKAIVAACELVYDDPKLSTARKAFNEYHETHGNDPTVYRQDYEWNKGPNFQEAYRAYRDLAEAKATLNKYLVQLDKLSNFEKEDKIEAIWNFLKEWRQMAYDWYVNEVKIYNDLKNNYKEAWEEYKNSVEYEDSMNYYKSYRPNYRWAEYDIENKFERDYYKDIDNFTRDISLRNGKVDEEKLNKVLDKELRDKYTKLVNDVTSKAGEITDASGLRVNARGEINGRIVGTKNTVDLWLTLVNGEGQGIQRPHYRGYCNIAK